MNKSLFVAVTILPLIFFIQPAAAQNIHLGGGVSYGTESEALSFRGSAFYNVPNSLFRIGSNLGYTTREHRDNRRTDRFYANINGYLIALQEPGFTLYGLTGINVSYHRTKFSPDEAPSYSATELYPGANAGIGMETNIGIGRQFTEAKYVIGHNDISGFVFNTGVRIGI